MFISRFSRFVVLLVACVAALTYPGIADAQTMPLVIPRPKQISAMPKGRAFRVNQQTRILISRGATKAEKRGPKLLQEQIASRFSLRLPINELVAGETAQNAFVFGNAKNTFLVPPAHAEGYAIRVSSQAVLIVGRDDAGLLWGAQTTIQLLEASEQDRTVAPVQILDWPTLSVRAVHLFHGQNALPFHEKLIDRVLSRFKMNSLFIQAEQLKWNADPLVAPSWGGTKADIKTEISYARERGMTVYPLVQSYGHLTWLLSNERNRQYAEDPETPYALNTTDPNAVAYLEKFVREADDLFEAPGFHVGLDEVIDVAGLPKTRGRFPFRSMPRTFPDLFVRNARHWHDFFTKRNKAMWMWADMALFKNEVSPSFGTAPSEEAAQAIRAALPKDTVMVDWQYGEQTDFPSLVRLKEAGFTRLVGATWFKGQNIQNFSRAVTKVGGMGMIQTTWAGYESNEKILDSPQRKQFEAFVLAADYFWNGGEGPAPDALPYKPDIVFARQWAGKTP